MNDVWCHQKFSKIAYCVGLFTFVKFSYLKAAIYTHRLLVDGWANFLLSITAFE